jgi:hypothetical protein
MEIGDGGVAAPRAYCGTINRHQLPAGGLLRWNLHACSDKRTVGCDRAATRGGSFVGNDRGIARRGPQYAVKSISSSAHCTVQFAGSQGERMTRMPEAGPGGP